MTMSRFKRADLAADRRGSLKWIRSNPMEHVVIDERQLDIWELLGSPEDVIVGGRPMLRLQEFSQPNIDKARRTAPAPCSHHRIQDQKAMADD